MTRAERRAGFHRHLPRKCGTGWSWERHPASRLNGISNERKCENVGSFACYATSAGSRPKGYTWWVGNCRWPSSRSRRRLLLVDCWRRKLPLNANDTECKWRYRRNIVLFCRLPWNKRGDGPRRRRRGVQWCRTPRDGNRDVVRAARLRHAKKLRPDRWEPKREHKWKNKIEVWLGCCGGGRMMYYKHVYEE